VTKLSIEPVSKAQFERLLPMIAAYQRFYEAESIDDERNRTFFSRFIAPSDDGMLLSAWQGKQLAGCACLYWSFTSIAAAETVLMNDLFVDPSARGQGVGRALIEASADVARARAAPITSSGQQRPTTTRLSISTTQPAPNAAPGSSTS
jgi:GNAT superfamily N-acetyltransferase